MSFLGEADPRRSSVTDVIPKRRRLAVATGADRRGQERHSLKIDGPLKQLGWVFVEQEAQSDQRETTSDVASAHTL
jgi:hypothetical protein